MQRECPQCHSALGYWDRTRLAGVLRWRQAIPFSSCRVLLRCSRAVILANLAFLAGFVAAMLGFVWKGSFILVAIFGLSSMIGVIAMRQVTIEVAESTQTKA